MKLLTVRFDLDEKVKYPVVTVLLHLSLSVLLTFTRGFWLAGSYCIQISRKTHIHPSIVPAEHTVTHSWLLPRFSLVLMFSLLAEVLHLTFVSHHPVTVLLSCIKRIKMKTISGLDTSVRHQFKSNLLYFCSVLCQCPLLKMITVHLMWISQIWLHQTTFRSSFDLREPVDEPCRAEVYLI